MNLRTALVGAVDGSAAAILGSLLLLPSAFAADLPSRKAPPPPPVSAVNWTGFYAGLDGGFVWDNSPATVVAAGEGLTQTGVQQWQAYPYYVPGVAVMNAAGFAAGGHVGWNYQLASFSSLVTGLETDALVFAGNGGHTSTFVTPGGLNASVAQIGRAMPWAGSTRARLGLLITPTLLVYGTGGVAYGAANVNEYAYGSALAATYAPGAQGRIYGGWAAGAGLEWALAQNWSIRAEYLHADLGTHAASFPGFAYGTVPSFPVPQQFLAYVPMRANTMKFGVSYHFNGLLTGDPTKDFPSAPAL